MADTRSIVRLFQLAWLGMLIPAFIAMLLVPKLLLHASINCCHAPSLDRFFALFTHLADGLVPTAVALILLLSRDLRSFLMMGLSCGLSALVVQLLKRTLFADMDRPSRFRDTLGNMDWVEGIDLHLHFSFPSGHSTAAFSMCFALAVVLGRRSWAVPLAMLAGLLAFSRVYLSQHFLQDIAAGSILGTLTAMAVHHVLYRSPFARKAWLARTLFRRQNQ
ncbi:MAG: phosphatase PAP2 family protein [Flavobacteriales bacterium]|nr:phosphatase PAP2 family protein [Flavobacteriales bacterium]